MYRPGDGLRAVKRIRYKGSPWGSDMAKRRDRGSITKGE